MKVNESKKECTKKEIKKMIDKIDDETYLYFLHRYIQGICNKKQGLKI